MTSVSVQTWILTTLILFTSYSQSVGWLNVIQLISGSGGMCLIHSAWEYKTGTLRVWGQPGLYSKTKKWKTKQKTCKLNLLREYGKKRSNIYFECVLLQSGCFVSAFTLFVLCCQQIDFLILWVQVCKRSHWFSQILLFLIEMRIKYPIS